MINWLLKPTTDIPSRLAKKASDFISPVDKEGSVGRGFLSGAIEGAGNVASDMTSPLSLASGALGTVARGAKSIYNTGKTVSKLAQPTMDLIEEAPAVKQIMPGMDDVNSILGDLARNLAKVPQGGKAANYGTNPAILPADMVGVGSEAVYNNSRTIPSAARSLEDVAYSILRDPLRKPSSGNLNLTRMMDRVAQARGR